MIQCANFSYISLFITRMCHYCQFNDLLPSNHPDIDDLFTTGEPHELPEWHPEISLMINMKELPMGGQEPALPVYAINHPNISKSYEEGRPMPSGHISITDKLKEYLPPGHPIDLDGMMGNPSKYPLPFGHPKLGHFITVEEEYPNGLPEVQVYFEHPDITKAYDAGRGLPTGHVSVEDRLLDYLPPGHPMNIDEMLSNPKEYPLPLGHPSLSTFVEISDYPNGLPSIPVYFVHPDISTAFDTGRVLPKLHPSVTEMFFEFLPPGHPTNIDEMLSNPKEYQLPLGHPDLSSFAKIKALPQGNPSVPVYFAHPNIAKAYEAGRPMPRGHISITDKLTDYLPPNHPGNLDEMLENPLEHPLPFGHPSLEQFISVENYPNGLPELQVYFQVRVHLMLYVNSTNDTNNLLTPLSPPFITTLYASIQTLLRAMMLAGDFQQVMYRWKTGCLITYLPATQQTLMKC